MLLWLFFHVLLRQIGIINVANNEVSNENTAVS